MQETIKARTKQFTIDVLRFVNGLSDGPQLWMIGKQLTRSAASVGANYRAACRAQSRAAFISKLAIVEEEADESLFWLELLVELHHASETEVAPLMKEGQELRAIVAASRKTAKANASRPVGKRS